jgi:hypothetical protein
VSTTTRSSTSKASTALPDAPVPVDQVVPPASATTPVDGATSVPVIVDASLTAPDLFPNVMPGDGPPIAGAVDPRGPALAALLAPPPVVTSDLAPPVVQRIVAPTGLREAWYEDGDWFLVLCPVYPRVVGDVRHRARAGDAVQLRADDRTITDLAAGYLQPTDIGG